MKERLLGRLFLLLLVMLCTVVPVSGQQTPPSSPPPGPPPALTPPPPLPPAMKPPQGGGGMASPPPLRMVSPGVFEMDGCRIVKKQNRVEFPAEVNMDKGLLEYILVENAGKVHESLLRTRISPYTLQIALLLLGVEGSLHPLAEQGENRTPEGDRVKIWVSWQDKGKEKKVPVEQWIAKDGKAAGALPWVFTGSVVVDGVFLAQADKSMVALFHDPSALIDHQLAEGASDEIWQVDSASVPPAGTAVTVIIEKNS
ncbi:MAG: hypothetical protein HY885_13485 [Deltaproteobacteria bacterium]|nr:hypothetical protein [Deltaproteobacteria bacterium]